MISGTLAVLLAASVATARVPDKAPCPVVVADTGYHSIHWYEAASVTAGSLLLFTVDAPVERWVQRRRTSTTDDVASVFRQAGDPRVMVASTAGIALLGVVTGAPSIRDAGLRAVASIGAGGIVGSVIKLGLGRGRPAGFRSATDFDPFSTASDSAGNELRGSLPSGHTIVAFAVATSLSDDLHSRAGSVMLFTLATGTALSRLNDDRHWLSDVASGAAIGVTSARLISGRWRIFGLRPPRVLLAPEFVAISWHLDLTP